MEQLLSMYLEDGTQNNKEFEVRFGTKDKSITKINYDGVIKKLLSLGFKFQSQNPEIRLRISLDKQVFVVILKELKQFQHIVKQIC